MLPKSSYFLDLRGSGVPMRLLKPSRLSVYSDVHSIMPSIGRLKMWGLRLNSFELGICEQNSSSFWDLRGSGVYLCDS